MEKFSNLLDLLISAMNDGCKYFLHIKMPFLRLPRPLVGARSDEIK
jgi:hypothetical protein